MRDKTTVIIEVSGHYGNVCGTFCNDPDCEINVTATDENIIVEIVSHRTNEIKTLVLPAGQTSVVDGDFELRVAAYGDMEECGSCESWHHHDFAGDCRDDDNRFVIN